MQFDALRFQPNRPLLKEITAERLNAVLAEIKKNRPRGERGITVRQSGDATFIGLAANFDGKTAAITIRPFELQVVNASETATPDWRVRVYASTLAGGSATDIGFSEGDDPPYLLAAEAGVVQAGLTIDQEGNVTSRWLEIVEQLSEDTETEFYVEIGTVAEQDGKFTVSNSRYGPIDANICRDWFSNPPTYSVTFFAVAEA